MGKRVHPALGVSEGKAVVVDSEGKAEVVEPEGSATQMRMAELDGKQLLPEGVCPNVEDHQLCRFSRRFLVKSDAPDTTTADSSRR